MESCDPVGTPMEIKDKPDLDQNGTPVDAAKYRSMIGALMYLTSSRLDIVHATCLCARYQAKPTEKHLKEVRRIFCYLWGIVNTGLWYTKDSGLKLTGFSDADYAGYGLPTGRPLHQSSSSRSIQLLGSLPCQSRRDLPRNTPLDRVEVLVETKDTLSSCSNLEAQQMQQIQDKSKNCCMVSFRQLYSHLKRLSQNDLQGIRIESGFKRLFAALFGQDIETFTGTMFRNVEQLEKKLDKEDYQEIGSMAAFNVLDTQFQMFIMSRVYLNDEYVAMTRSYFIQYTQQQILEFRNILIQHLESVKKSIDERAQLKREYDRWVNERQMQKIEEKVDTSKAMDASSVDTKSSRTETKEQDTSSRSGNDVHDDGTDIRPIYDEEPMTKSQFSKEKSNEAKVKHDIDVLETINIELEHKVAKLLKENETLKKHYKELFDSIKITRPKTIEHTTSLIATNDKFKAQLQEKGFAIAALKNELRKSTGNSMNTKFAKSSILGKPMLQPHINQSVVRQPTAFKSERPTISKPRCDSQVDVNYDLSKPVITHYLPKEREAASAKPQHMIASSNSRISSKNMPRFSSNDMVHNHYLEEAKKKTQERSRNSEPSLMPSSRSQSTTNGSKPKPRSNTQTSRNWHAS
nr:copia protein [Tanacetum cinerariifolium]